MFGQWMVVFFAISVWWTHTVYGQSSLSARMFAPDTMGSCDSVDVMVATVSQSAEPIDFMWQVNGWTIENEILATPSVLTIDAHMPPMNHTVLFRTPANITCVVTQGVERVVLMAEVNYVLFPAPTAYILGPAMAYRNTGLQLIADMSPPTCVPPSYEYHFQWSVQPELPGLDSSVFEKATLSIPPGILEPDIQYFFNFSVTDTMHPVTVETIWQCVDRPDHNQLRRLLESSGGGGYIAPNQHPQMECSNVDVVNVNFANAGTYAVTIPRAPVQIVLKGGTNMIVSKLGPDLEFDASGSFDPDDMASPAEQWAYVTWRCGAGAQMCPFFSSTGEPGLRKIVPRPPSVPSGVYPVDVELIHLVDGRSAIMTLLVHWWDVNEDPIVVTVDVIRSPGVPVEHPVASDQFLRLRAKVQGASPLGPPMSFQWSLGKFNEIMGYWDVQQIDYSAVLTELGRDVLALKGGTLSPGLYRFTVSTQDPSTQEQVLDSVDVSVASPPSNVECNVSPKAGFINGTFLVFCSDVVASSGFTPTYTIRYGSNPSPGMEPSDPTQPVTFENGGKRLTMRKVVPATKIRLPAGDHLLEITTSDANGGKTLYYTRVVVQELATPVETLCASMNITNSALQTAVDLGSISGAFQLLRIVWDVLYDPQYETVTCPYIPGDPAYHRLQALRMLFDAFDMIVADGVVTVDAARFVGEMVVNLFQLTDPVTGLYVPNVAQEATLIALFGIIGDTASQVPQLASKMVRVMARMLKTVDCSHAGDLLQLFRDVSFKSVKYALKGEEGVQEAEESTSMASSKVEKIEPFTVTTGGTTVTLNPEILQEGGNSEEDATAVTVTAYSSEIRQCFKKVNSAIISIDVEGYQKTGASDSSVVFSLPLDEAAAVQIAASAATGMCSPVPECKWWDASAYGGQGAWSSEGCQVVGIEEWLNGNKQPGDHVECLCEHLTDFAVLLNEGACSALARFPAAQEIYRTTALFYLIFALGVFQQAIKIETLKSILPAHKLMRIQHILMFLVCIGRVGSSLRFSADLDIAYGVAAGIVSALPYMFMYWIFSLLVFQWASIYHFGMTYKGSAFKKVRPFFIISNLLVMIIMMLSFSLVATNATSEEEVEAKKNMALVSAILMALINFAAGGSFFVYSNIIQRALTGGSKSSSVSRPSTSGSSSRKSTSTQIRQESHRHRAAIRMKICSYIIIICFVGQGVMTVGALQVNPVLLAFTSCAQVIFEVMSMAVVLYIYRAVIIKTLRAKGKELELSSSSQESASGATVSGSASSSGVNSAFRNSEFHGQRESVPAMNSDRYSDSTTGGFSSFIDRESESATTSLPVAYRAGEGSAMV